MKRKILFALLAPCALALSAAPYLPQNGEYYELDSNGNVVRYGDNAETEGSVAIHRDSESFVAWATGYESLSYGKNVLETYQTPEKALGKVTGDIYDIVCLGDGGSIVLTFDKPITDDEGYDFAVFENAFNNVTGFLELAYVEVSTDGEHYLRFPNFYLGTSKLGPFDNENYPYLFYNLASKYGVDYGHGFDLSELEYAYNYALSTPSEESSFSEEYASSLLDNYQYVDLSEINYVRIIDIIGDGENGCFDSSGYPIFDPSNCVETAGFDLQGVGVINQVPEPAWSAAVFGALALALALRFRK